MTFREEWCPSDDEACEFCGLTKHTTLEMIGPTTVRSCLDCQEIPPAFRRTKRKVTGE